MSSVSPDGRKGPGTASSARLELWGGVECTVNRVGDQYFDQVERSGHAVRADDLERCADLGIRALRYPLLWERMQPHESGAVDWAWADERTSRLRTLGVRLIAGLTHHGSGPRHTSLVQASFASGLAAHAGRVAQRYPWIDAYTPVNEPLTTARFSGLYGLWYPHGRDDATFARALVTQCRAITASMTAIRRVNPRAQLIQTEDLGRTYATRAMTRLADFYNQRRWLSLDLLCGRLTKTHPLYRYLRSAGIGADELAWQADHACPPDLIGINHYLTSDRFLDEHIEDYEPRTHGTTRDGQRFADVEAVRGCLDCEVDPRGVLQEAWQRYGIPVAITEVHLGSTRDEQLRWLQECWDAAARARDAGVDVREVTVWSLFGSYDWNTLVTASRGWYEPGAFDVRAPVPRVTALGRLMRELSEGQRRLEDPVLTLPGWWRRPDRLHGPRLEGRSSTPTPEPSADGRSGAAARPLLIVGGGALAQAFVQACDVRGLAYRALPLDRLGVADAPAVERAMAALRPWGVVQATEDGHTEAAADGAAARHAPVDADAAARIAEACRTSGARLVCFSSDLLFEGRTDDVQRAFVESDAIAPLGHQTRRQADVEARVLAACPASLVVRTGALFGAGYPHHPLARLVDAVWQRVPLRFDGASHRAHTYVVDLANTVLDLMIDEECGVWHLVNGSASDARLAQCLTEQAGAGVLETPQATTAVPMGRRHGYPILDSERARLLLPLEEAVARFVQEAGCPHVDSCGFDVPAAIVAAGRPGTSPMVEAGS